MLHPKDEKYRFKLVAVKDDDQQVVLVVVVVVVDAVDVVVDVDGVSTRSKVKGGEQVEHKTSKILRNVIASYYFDGHLYVLLWISCSYYIWKYALTCTAKHGILSIQYFSDVYLFKIAFLKWINE